MHARVAAVALDDPDPAADALRLRGERLTDDRDHLRIPLDAGHRVPGTRQPQRLRAPAHAHVQHPQPLPDREPPGYLLVELPGHQLLPYRLAQPVPAAGPGVRRALGERRCAQGRSPRLTCGFGSLRRRI
ncbi:hypothetical protein GCM10010365_31330 [Streptomyces poonensis]|uniref:Uncharacterized protein n=1 Tax=Streptomyces poonensis TaxID=68255 RepID=A0A918PHI8_9ACTN|nr:hypothetical protein GCM10010365_31330 [Streptomyces poonensis]GLJ88443.1 hypothetical protein GCM10017589_10430 [Streptomyces poonensis]